jgi:hypothetical protein
VGAPPPPPPEPDEVPLLEELELLEEDDELLDDDEDELLDEEDELLDDDELLELEEEEELLLEEELELLEDEEEELDDELLLDVPVYSSAPMSKAVPVGRGSPSMSVVSPVMVVPASTTLGMAEARWRSQIEGLTKKAFCAVGKFVANVVVAPKWAPIGLFVRLFRMKPPLVAE